MDEEKKTPAYLYIRPEEDTPLAIHDKIEYETAISNIPDEAEWYD